MREIVLRRVCKAFGEKQVLHDLSMTFPGGKLTCVQGVSGAGKTTLLRLLAGLEQPDAGEIEGVPVKIAFVFQEDRLSEDFNAVRNVQLVTGGRVSTEAIRHHLSEIGLEEDSFSQPVREYSGGMKRRAAIVRAVCHDAELVLLDEPFKGLDEAMKRRTMDYVKKHTAGKTVICVTHESSEADYLGGNLVSLDSMGKQDGIQGKEGTGQ